MQTIQQKDQKLEEELVRLGVTPTALKEMGVWEEFTKGDKTSQLVPVEIKTEAGVFKTKARLSLRMAEDNVRVIPNFYRPEPNLSDPYYGYRLTEQDQYHLKKTGNLNKVISLTHPDGKTTLAFVSLDRLTNEIVAVQASHFKCPKEIYGVELTEEQKARLWAGESTVVRGMNDKGRIFDARIQFNASTRKLDFRVPGTLDIRNELRVPKQIDAYKLSKTEIEKLRNGEIVQLKNLTDKNGTVRDLYLEPNLRTGQVKVYDWGSPNLKADVAVKAKVNAPKLKPKKRGQKL